MEGSRHIFCLTIDTDPDGANSPRGAGADLSWAALSASRTLPEQVDASLGRQLGSVPITWFVRIDGQIESIHGSALYLLDAFHSLWESAVSRGDEIGWHPHLHGPGRAAGLLSDPRKACDELARLWALIGAAGWNPRCFRNGEGWHLPETLAQVEAFGIACDSSAIPGRGGRPGHPRNWIGAPNHPYFPDGRDIRRAGAPRLILELPMTTWSFAAPYDDVPRTRYMNPAVHPALFNRALENWTRGRTVFEGGLWVWVLVFHPDEAFPEAGADDLYARDPEALAVNIENLVRRLTGAGQRAEFATISEAARQWRRSLEDSR